MFRLISVVALLAGLSAESAFAFAPPNVASRCVRADSSALNMGQSQDQEKRFAASVLTAAYIFANAVSVAPALALPDDFGTTQVVAAKSGGRMGGRSSVGSRGSSSSYKPSSSSSSTHIERTTVIHSPTVVASPVTAAPPVYGGYYAPDPVGVGLSVGLSAVNSIGREMREQNQEREINRERQELSEARMRETELEGRLRALEAAQAAGR